MSRTLTVTLSPSSINTAIQELERIKKNIRDKSAVLTRRLAEIGLEQAQILFTGAMYDGVNDVECEVVQTDNGYMVVAKGQAVCFIEFGSGVFYNGTDAYPGKRPPDVVGIGQYGLGQGKKKGWVYRDEAGERQFTRGNPPAAAMFNASERMRSQVTQICREVFGS